VLVPAPCNQRAVQPQTSLADQRANLVPDRLGIPMTREAPRTPVDQSNRPIHQAQHQVASVRGEHIAVEWPQLIIIRICTGVMATCVMDAAPVDTESSFLPEDKAALALFVAHRGKLVDYASGIMGNHAGGEDIVQEAWLRFSSVTRKRFLDDPLGYLYRIVRNAALDGRRRTARESRHVVADRDEAVEALPEDRPTPELHSLHREELTIVRAAWAELPERTRIALYMHRIEGRKLKEIADHLGISVSLVHLLVAEGVKHCRQRLRDL